MLLSLLLMLAADTEPTQPSRIIEQKCAMAVASQIPAEPSFKLDFFDLRNASDPRYADEIINSYERLDEAAKDLNARLRIFESDPVPAAPSLGENDQNYRSMLADRLRRAAWNTSEYIVAGHIGIVRIRYKQYCLNNHPNSTSIYVSQKMFEGEQ